MKDETNSDLRNRMRALEEELQRMREELREARSGFSQLADRFSLIALQFNTLRHPCKHVVDDDGSIVKREGGEPVTAADIIPGARLKNVYTGEGYATEDEWEADAKKERLSAAREGRRFEEFAIGRRIEARRERRAGEPSSGDTPGDSAADDSSGGSTDVS